MDFDRLQSLVAALEREGVNYAVFGAMAQPARSRTLYSMKRDTIRLKDRADAEMLRKRFELEDP